MGTIAIKKGLMAFKVSAMNVKVCRTCMHMVVLPDDQGQRCTLGGFYVDHVNGCKEWVLELDIREGDA
jgi:hypothetical protein